MQVRYVQNTEEHNNPPQICRNAQTVKTGCMESSRAKDILSTNANVTIKFPTVKTVM